MSPRHFDTTENAELRAKIDEAKRRLPLPDLLSRLGLGEHAKKSARCLWHDDQHPRFPCSRAMTDFGTTSVSSVIEAAEMKSVSL
jgi:hypothetical protein